MKKYIINNFANKEKGITLIALIITIIVLLILVGISLATVFGENGIINKAIIAKENQEISKITEKLLLEKGSLVVTNSNTNITTSNYIEYIKGKNIIKDEDIEGNPENGSVVIIVEDRAFLIEDISENDIKIEYQGKVSELKPIIEKIEIIKTTTNIIQIKVTGKRIKQYEYYIKKESEIDYKKDGDNSTGEYSYEVKQNEKYKIKVLGINNIGQVYKEIDGQTGIVEGLTQANTTFAISPNTWTKGNVTVTVSTTVTGYTLQTSKNGTDWETTNTQILSINGPVYARVVDTTNQATGYASIDITNIDNTPPTKPTVNLNGYTSGTTTSSNVTQTFSSTDTGSGIAKYQYSHDNVNWLDVPGNPWVIASDGSWNFYIRAVDNVGNIGAVSDVYTITRNSIIPISNAISKIKVGDYIAYNSGTSYASGWRVLYKNTSTNVLGIISNANVETVTIRGLSGYNSCVSTLNSISNKYLNTTYATSARSVGSDPNNPAGTTAIRYGEIGMINGDSTYTTDINAMSAANLLSGTWCWLASRTYGQGGEGDYIFVNYYVRYYSGGVQNANLGRTDWYPSKGGPQPGDYSQTAEGTSGVRPIIYLKNTIKINASDPTKNGSSLENAWQITN